MHRGSLKLRPGHPERSVNLALALWTRFGQNGQTQDLEDAIQLCRGSLKLRQSRQAQDLESAIQLYHDSLEICSIGHPDRSDMLMSLASALYTIPKEKPGEGYGRGSLAVRDQHWSLNVQLVGTHRSGYSMDKQCTTV